MSTEISNDDSGHTIETQTSSLPIIVNSSSKNLQHIERPVARVFLFEQCTNVDVTSAFEFGAIHPLFKGYDKLKRTNNRPAIWETDVLQDAIIQKLEENKFDPEIDYILIAGHVIPLVMFAVTLALNFDCEEGIRFLFWSTQWKRYVDADFKYGKKYT